MNTNSSQAHKASTYSIQLLLTGGERQRRLYSQGLRIFPFDMTFSQPCSVLPFLAIFWNSNVVK